MLDCGPLVRALDHTGRDHLQAANWLEKRSTRDPPRAMFETGLFAVIFDHFVSKQNDELSKERLRSIIHLSDKKVRTGSLTRTKLCQLDYPPQHANVELLLPLTQGLPARSFLPREVENQASSNRTAKLAFKCTYFTRLQLSWLGVVDPYMLRLP